MTHKPLTFRSVSVTPVTVPLKRPLGTSANTLTEVSLALVDLETEEGVSGRTYAFCHKAGIARGLVPIVAEISELLAGALLAPLELNARVGRYLKLADVVGPLSMAASSIDTAVWDAFATAAGMPLATALGGAPQPLLAYNSNGLGLTAIDALGDEAEALLEGDFQGVKLRLGRPDFEQDLEAVRAVRRRLPDHVKLMVDFNQALSFGVAMDSCLRLDGEGVYWIEEPVRHDDYRHMALIAQQVRTPIQIGENFTGLTPLAAALGAVASDYVMLDLDRIGGVSGWRQATGLAAAYGREVSSHLFPEVSAHLLAATPGRHWLEYVDWAEPVLEAPLKIVGGKAIVPDGPGAGLRWDKAAVAKYRLD